MFSQDPYNQEFGYKALTTFWLDFSIAEGLVKRQSKRPMTMLLSHGAMITST